jgi:hypothetical protein
MSRDHNRVAPAKKTLTTTGDDQSEIVFHLALTATEPQGGDNDGIEQSGR